MQNQRLHDLTRSGKLHSMRNLISTVLLSAALLSPLLSPLSLPQAQAQGFITSSTSGIFKLTIQQYALPQSIMQFIPPQHLPTPADKREGVIVYVFAADESTPADMVEITVTYWQAGKQWTRIQQGSFNKGGCWPAPCRSGGSVFFIGAVDLKDVKVEVKPVVWESREVGE